MKRNNGSIHRFGVALVAIVLCGLTASIASATPSTQVWIPSTDIQPYKTVHLNFDSYIRTGKEPNSNTGYFGIPDGGNLPPLYDFGPTVGVLPFEKIQAEVGFDLIYGGANTPAGLDKYPIYGNFKIGMPEDNTWVPAVAVGMYGIGTKKGEVANGVYTKTGTDANIYYGLNKKASVAGVYDRNGAKGDDSGVLASWDRTMSEISDKLWVAIDYQGGKNAYGATSFGASWAFAKNVSVIFGYDIFNNKDRAGQNTATIQVDINFP